MISHLFLRLDVMSTVILKRLPEHFLDGLPADDQIAIQAAVGTPMTHVGTDQHGRAELEFRDAAGDIHTIWIDEALVTDQ